MTFWADWTERYDQGGLLLALKRATPTTTTTTATAPPAEKWIKTGIELYQGHPRLSTVGCDRWADWSVSPLGTPPVDPGRGLTLEVVREGDEHGKSAWVYRVVLGADGAVREKIPLREICWIFADEDDKDGEEWVLDVSPLVARPEKGAAEVLKVEFFDFKVEWLA